MEKAEHMEYIDKIYDALVNDSCRKADPVSNKPSLQFMERLNSMDSNMSVEDRKRLGSFYTDSSIVEYILTLVLKDIDIAENPYIRILDPSCGCGFFLTYAYDLLKEKYKANLKIINRKFPELKMDQSNIHEHILQYNLFGADIDEYAVKLSNINLMLKKNESSQKPNVICCDSLLNIQHTLIGGETFMNQGFDIIVGNPPYIGHKKISGEYRKELKGIYGDIFKDKSDISFCFFISSIERLNNYGRLCFITSRYFLESPSGREIRSYIKQSCTIKKIVDFYGVRVMKGISVDPAIIYIEKNGKCNNLIDVAKGKSKLKKLSCGAAFEQLEEGSSSYFKTFYVPQHSLKDEGWVLWDADTTKILDKIRSYFRVSLSDVCKSFQGIITGCDKAFIVDENIIGEYGIERDITRRWIKGSCIKKYRVEGSSRRIIYSDFIDDISLYPGAMSYIYKQKDKLNMRRECIKGIRQWYQLQWGRNSSLFEMKKIVFPYKSGENRFAIDEGSYSSADVYGMYIKPEYNNSISYEFLCGLLNSKLYDFYFKSFAKKLGDNLYDYYPNTIMRLLIPAHEIGAITGWAMDILSCTSSVNMKGLMKNIDEYIYDMLKLTDGEIEIVEKGLEI